MAVELDRDEVQLPHGDEEEDNEGRFERITHVGSAGDDNDEGHFKRILRVGLAGNNDNKGRFERILRWRRSWQKHHVGDEGAHER